MFKDFQYRSVPLSHIKLDSQNPRVISEKPLASERELLEYLYDNEDLAKFVQKISRETKNPAAERPYVVKEGDHYTVVEGNSRIAAYKVLTGQLDPPKDHDEPLPKMDADDIEQLLTVDVAIAPNRERLMPILAELHFGRGDKSGWTFLSSRKTIAAEFAKHKKVDKVARIFKCSPSEILGFLLEWSLYQEALKLPWTPAEREALLKPRLEFNPPIRFFQTSGHTEKVGIVFDRANSKIEFKDEEARRKFRHLILKLVINRSKGLTATSKYDEVFADYVPVPSSGGSSGQSGSSSGTPGGSSSGDPSGGASGGQGGPSAGSGGGSPGSNPLKPGRLFDLKPSGADALLDQLLKEARSLDCKRHPGAGTALFRTILEAITKRIVDNHSLDPRGKVNSLEDALTCIIGASAPLTGTEKKLLGDFRRHHLDYLNLTLHANRRPDFSRLESAVGSVIEFVRKYA